MNRRGSDFTRSGETDSDRADDVVQGLNGDAGLAIRLGQDLNFEFRHAAALD